MEDIRRVLKELWRSRQPNSKPSRPVPVMFKKGEKNPRSESSVKTRTHTRDRPRREEARRSRQNLSAASAPIFVLNEVRGLQQKSGLQQSNAEESSVTGGQKLRTPTLFGKDAYRGPHVTGERQRDGENNDCVYVCAYYNLYSPKVTIYFVSNHDSNGAHIEIKCNGFNS